MPLDSPEHSHIRAQWLDSWEVPIHSTVGDHRLQGIIGELGLEHVLEIIQVTVVPVGLHDEVPYLGMEHILQRQWNLVERDSPVGMFHPHVPPAVAERIRFRSRGFRRLGSGDRTHESTSVTRRLDRVHIHPIRRLRTRRGRSSSPPLARPADPRAWNEGRLGEAHTKSGKFARCCSTDCVDWTGNGDAGLETGTQIVIDSSYVPVSIPTSCVPVSIPCWGSRSMAEHRVMSEDLLDITHYRSRRCYESQSSFRVPHCGISD